MAKRSRSISKNKIRNLAQYKNMDQEEFDRVFDERFSEPKKESFSSPLDKENKIKEIINNLGKDYDLSDMKVNDLSQLNHYASLIIQLEDIEEEIEEQKDRGIDQTNITIIEKLNQMASRLRGDISSIFQDLGISRKFRKSENEQSVIDALTDIKNRARRYIEGKMVYVFCPKCRMLLFTGWVHYKEKNSNLLKCTCGKCGETFTEDLGRLYETDHKNLKDVLIP